MFEGHSMADSHHFMTKDVKPVDGMSIAESSEMIKEEEEDDNKMFEDQTSNGGTQMDKASPYKFIDDSSETSPYPKFLDSDKKMDLKKDK